MQKPQKSQKIYAVQVFRSSTHVMVYQSLRKSLEAAKREKEILKPIFTPECFISIETYDVPF